MTSSQRQSIQNRPPTSGGRWIDAATAAARMGKSERRIRQLCEQSWCAAGLAEKRRGGDATKAAWFVREDADPLLASIKRGDQMPIDLTQLTEHQRRELGERKQILNDWGKAIASGRSVGEATADFIDLLRVTSGRVVSEDTLQRWRQRFASDGLAGLIDGRSTARREPGDEAPTDFIDEVLRLWLGPNKLTLKRCHKLALQIASERGWPTCSYFVCNRAKSRIPVATIALKRGGVKAFTDVSETYIDRDYSTLASNEQWVGDSHRFDVLVDVGGGKLARPWLTALMDMRSRRIVAYSIVTHDPNEDLIIATLAAGIREHGVPLGLYLDNGKDWTSRALTGHTKRERREALRDARRAKRDGRNADYKPWGGIFGELQIDVTLAQPYHGQSKTIERFFGTLAADFAKLWPTYCGRNTVEKPHGLSNRIKRGWATQLDEFRDAFAQWVEGEYHNAPHHGDAMDGRSPLDVFDAELRAKRVAPAELLQLMLMKASKPVTVAQNGVAHQGLRYGRNLPDLLKRQGERVILRIDPADASFVIVCSIDGKVICRASCNERLPANSTPQHVREAIAAKRQATRAQKAHYETRLHLNEDLADVMIRRASAAQRAAKAQTRPDRTPPTLQPVRTEHEEQMEAVRRVLQPQRAMRTAVGAESILPQVMDYKSSAFDRNEDDDIPTFGNIGQELQRQGGRASEDAR